jgi:hypothetical protein
MNALSRRALSWSARDQYRAARLGRVQRPEDVAMSPNEKLDAFIKILTIVAWPGAIVWLAWYLRDELKVLLAGPSKPD